MTYFDTRPRLFQVLFALSALVLGAATNSVAKVLPKGIGLGVAQEKMFAQEIEETELRYTANDVFLFVTDEITEGRKIGEEEFGDERLSSILKENSTLCAEGIRDKIFEAVNSFANGVHPHDDQTVVVVKAV
jgi:sigma-B regulation protein RsbU (phosphoserine phosphatase)